MFIIWDPVVLNAFYTQQLNMVLSYLLGPKSWLFVKQLTSAFTRTFGIKLMQISSRSSLNVITPSSSHCLAGVCGHSWPVHSPGGELCPTGAAEPAPGAACGGWSCPVISSCICWGAPKFPKSCSWWSVWLCPGLSWLWAFVPARGKGESSAASCSNCRRSQKPRRSPQSWVGHPCAECWNEI